MIHAYNECYLNDVMKNVSDFFDIAINRVGLDADEIADRFSSSRIANGIENGNPNYLSGKSATEMLSELLEQDISFNQVPLDRSEEYWSGWILAYAQWYLNKSFKEIISVMPLSKLISFYHPYHEAPEEKMIEYIESLLVSDNPLKTIRLERHLSQSQLSKLSGVKLRNIECYEQGDIDIKNARAETLYALAKVLDCTIEYLIK